MDASEDTIYEYGHVTENNHIHPDTRFYRKVFRDAEGNLTSKSWRAEEIARDRRVPAKGQDEQRFEISADGDELQLIVRLMYRSMSQEAANDLDIAGLEVPSIEMARTELEVQR